MDLKQEIRDLESKGVYIHLSYDHYKDGTNCNFSIEVVDNKVSPIKRNQSYWYGDNHEFGDTIDVLESAIRFAKWLLEGENMKWYFFDARETVTEEGMENWCKKNDIMRIGHEVLYTKIR